MNKFLGKMRNRKGFTLIELIVVMAIIGILVLLAAPRYLNYTKDAHVTSMQADAKVLENLVLAYSATNEGELPVTATDVDTSTFPQGVQDALAVILEAGEEVFELDEVELNKQLQGLKNEVSDYVVRENGDIIYVEALLENSVGETFVGIEPVVIPAP